MFTFVAATFAQIEMSQAEDAHAAATKVHVTVVHLIVIGKVSVAVGIVTTVIFCLNGRLLVQTIIIQV